MSATPSAADADERGALARLRDGLTARRWTSTVAVVTGGIGGTLGAPTGPGGLVAGAALGVAAGKGSAVGVATAVRVARRTGSDDATRGDGETRDDGAGATTDVETVPGRTAEVEGEREEERDATGDEVESVANLRERIEGTTSEPETGLDRS